MSPESIIKELLALELLHEQARQKAHSLRKDLERFYAPAPSGGDIPKQVNKVKSAVVKRMAHFDKINNKKNES